MILSRFSKRLCATAFYCCLLAVAFGQSSFLTPKKINNPYQTHLWLSEYSDLVYLEKNLSNFSHIEVVKVDGSVDIAKATALCEKLTLLQEVQLHRFEGIISDEDIQHLEWVPEVSIYIPEKRVDATVLNDAWALLSQVSLRFEVVPDNFEFLKGWKQLRSLSVLGNMDREEATALIEQVSVHLPKLKHLELSLVSVLELPPKINSCKQLHSIKIVDGSDWAQGKLLSDLGEYILPVRVGSKKVSVDKGISADKNVYMPLKWISSRPYLNAKERSYLKSIYPDVAESEVLNWIEEEELRLDFAESSALSEYPFTSMTTGRELLGEFKEGTHNYLAHTEYDQVFLGDGEWALLIPKRSLQFTDGRPYEGPYHVSVKNWSDPEIMLAAGITLSYDSNRVEYALNPSFGVEIMIKNESRTQDLQIKPGYFAEVHMAKALHETDRFYAYNSQLKRWQHFHDYDYQFDYSGLPVKIDFYQFYKDQKTAKIRADFHVWTLDEAFQTNGFNYVMPPHLFEMRLGKTKGQYVLDPANQSKEIRRIVRGKNQIGLRALPRNKKADKGIQELLIFDRTHSLFPELNAFEGYRLAFNTQLSYEQVLAFFKERNFVDARIQNMGNAYYLELKTHRQIWTIKLRMPSEQLGDVSAKERFKADRELHQRYQKYRKTRDTKGALWYQTRKGQETLVSQQQLNQVLGSAGLSKKKVRFMIQSTGTFCFAHPVQMQESNIELILCELGKIPLDVKRVALSYEGEPYSVTYPKIPQTKQIPVRLDQLRYLMAETQSGELFYITGDALRNLQIKDNTLTFVELKPFKNIPQNTADWLKEMGVRTTKKRKKP